MSAEAFKDAKTYKVFIPQPTSNMGRDFGEEFVKNQFTIDLTPVDPAGQSIAAVYQPGQVDKSSVLAIAAVVMATVTSQTDDGEFEVVLKDDKYITHFRKKGAQ